MKINKASIKIRGQPINLLSRKTINKIIKNSKNKKLCPLFMHHEMQV